MAGGAFGNAAEGADKLAGSLHNVEAISHSLTGTLGVLKLALNAALGVGFKNELEKTAQVLYKVRTSLGATATDALKFASAVRELNNAQVSTTRSLVEMYATLRNSSGLMVRSTSQLADIAKRLQREFPQASGDAAKAIAQMASETVDFERLMAKGTNSALAWAEANQKWGSEYARVLIAARGDLDGTIDKQRQLLTAFEESEKAVGEMAQTWSEAFKSSSLGVAGILKSFAELVNWIGKLGGGEVGKAVSPLIATGASMLAYRGAIGLGQKYLGSGNIQSIAGSALHTASSGVTRVRVENFGELASKLPTSSGLPPLEGLDVAAPNAAPKPSWSVRMRNALRNQFTTFSLTRPGDFGGPQSWSQRGMGAGFAGLAALQGYSSAKMTGSIGEAAGAGSVIGGAGAGAIAGMQFGPAGAAIGASIGAVMNAHVQTASFTNKLLEDIKALNAQGNRISEQQLLADRVAAAPTAAAGREIMRGQYAFEAQTAAMNLDVAKKEQERIKSGMTAAGGKLAGKPGWWNYVFNQKDLQKAEQLQTSLATAQANEQKAREQYAQSQAMLLQSGQFEVGVGQAAIGSVQAQYAALAERAQSGDYAAMQQMLKLEAARRGEMAGKRNINIGSMVGANLGIEQGSAFRTQVGGRLGEVGSILSSGKDQATMQQELQKTFGLSEELSKNIVRIWESTPAIQQEIVAQINDQTEALRTQKKALTDIYDQNSRLLELKVQGIDADKRLAQALKLPPMAEAELTARQAAITTNKLQEQTNKLRQMETMGGFTQEQVEQQRNVVKQITAELADQVDYIRRGWEEMFTQTALNLPGGSFLMKTMTGMMEKGPAFAPFTSSSMVNGNLAGHGNYEAIMGFGKASAFSLMQKQMADALSGSAADLSSAASALREAAGALRGAPAG